MPAWQLSSMHRITTTWLSPFVASLLTQQRSSCETTMSGHTGSSQAGGSGDALNCMARAAQSGHATAGLQRGETAHQCHCALLQLCTGVTLMRLRQLPPAFEHSPAAACAMSCSAPRRTQFCGGDVGPELVSRDGIKQALQQEGKAVTIGYQNNPTIASAHPQPHPATCVDGRDSEQ